MSEREVYEAKVRGLGRVLVINIDYVLFAGEVRVSPAMGDKVRSSFLKTLDYQLHGSGVRSKEAGGEGWWLM